MLQKDRLEDRFGKVPHEGEELMQVVPLRQLGKRLGCEKILLKQGKMQMQFVSNLESPFFKSAIFSKVLHFANKQLRRCELTESKGHNIMLIYHVKTVGEAVALLHDILNEEVMTNA